MYLENTQWAQKQERELRIFAADPEQKRLRYKPMKGRERAFLHALAEDFGFDSESMDPEPHRHVAIFKTPRFVMAPMKTLAECARIRQIQRAITASAAAEAPKKIKASNIVGDPLNAFVIKNARFGLMAEELRTVINPVISMSGMQFDISFLPSEEVILKPLQQTIVPERALEASLTAIKPDLSKVVSAHSFGRIQLCRIDDSLNILQLESDNANSGWSQVAAKAAAPRRAAANDLILSSSKNKFTVFSTATIKGKNKKMPLKQETSVEEDWEAAETREEEKERLASGENTAGNSGDEGHVGGTGGEE
jgi:transcriptional repressor NF-X1